jgi:hypothetical protein
MTPEEFSLKLNNAPDIFGKWRRATMQQMVMVTKREVQRVTPVKEGTLRRSWATRVEGTGERGIVGTNLIYARPVNRRRQFVERGWEAAQEPIQTIIDERGGVLWEDLINA